jgi:phosphoribosyl 1,2-cyclic phosphate phosphodiesterase
VKEDLIREYPYVFRFPKYPGAPEWHLHVIDEEPFLVYPNTEDRELIWVHDVGYHYRHADGSLVPTSRCLEDMIDRADPATMACSTGGIEIIPVRGMHDKLPVLGFRFGQIAYLTDFSSIPESEFPKLEGLKHLTLNTVGYKPHHSHFSLDEVLELADRIGAENTWLTHLSHSFPCHSRFCEELESLCATRGIRSRVMPAYDGLTIC